MAVEIRVPTLGESVTEATVATWFKQPGEAVAVDEMICELETDKVTVEVPSPVAGVIIEHVAKAGETVEVAALLATIEEGAAARSPAPAATAATPGEPTHLPAAAAPPAPDVQASPAAKKAMAAVSWFGGCARMMKTALPNPCMRRRVTRPCVSIAAFFTLP